MRILKQLCISVFLLLSLILFLRSWATKALLLVLEASGV